jgi:hypothetical protein
MICSTSIFDVCAFISCVLLITNIVCRWGTEWIRYVLDHFWHLEDEGQEVKPMNCTDHSYRIQVILYCL